MNESSLELGPVSQAVVTNTVRLTQPDTAEVRRIRLRIDDPAFRYSVGQSIGVLVPGPHPFGNRYHTRRYSIAGGDIEDGNDAIWIDLLVRRCFYVDEVSGEAHPGIASNYLCDAQAGQEIAITGPFRSPFRVPAYDRSDILMIGAGTGVAPFRSFVQEIFRARGGWRGRVHLYYGAHSGMDLLYRNDHDDDLALYYDHASFQAFRSVLAKPLASEADTLEHLVEQHIDDIWAQVQAPHTHLYLAGLDTVVARFDTLMQTVAGSLKVWQETREQLRDEGRWSELIYS